MSITFNASSVWNPDRSTEADSWHGYIHPTWRCPVPRIQVDHLEIIIDYAKADLDVRGPVHSLYSNTIPHSFGLFDLIKPRVCRVRGLPRWSDPAHTGPPVTVHVDFMSEGWFTSGYCSALVFVGFLPEVYELERLNDDHDVGPPPILVVDATRDLFGRPYELDAPMLCRALKEASLYRRLTQGVGYTNHNSWTQNGVFRSVTIAVPKHFVEPIRTGLKIPHESITYPDRPGVRLEVTAPLSRDEEERLLREGTLDETSAGPRSAGGSASSNEGDAESM